jgi:hypothetical protein
MTMNEHEVRAAENTALDWAKAAALILVLLIAAGALLRYAVPYILDTYGFLEAMAALAVSGLILAYLAVGLFRLLRRLIRRTKGR